MWIVLFIKIEDSQVYIKANRNQEDQVSLAEW